jgi:2-hydroxychromene-2-carboxylate isomerase
MKDIFAYCGYTSPFAYLAKDPIFELERDYDVTIRWRPYTVYVPEVYGGVDERSERQWRKVRYLYQDMRRLANKRGMIVRGPQKVFTGMVACYGALYAEEKGVFRPYNDIVYDRFWKRDLDVDDPAAIGAVLKSVGADPAGFPIFMAGPGVERYEAIRAEAHERGVFGVPTVFVDGELFWGYDRLPLLRERLAELGCRKAAGERPA